MKKYIAFLRIRILNGLQYRAAAYAGIATQFAWGKMTLLMFRAFYQNGASSFPMSFSQLSSYIWLQQALLALTMPWFFDNEIFGMITSGNIAYELCRPVDIYSMWYLKNVATRFSMALLRCFPILLIAAILPRPYNISLPATPYSGIMFVISLLLGFLVLVAISMLIYISVFYTMSPLGIRMLSVSIIDFFSGALIPIPFFPSSFQKLMVILPFSSIKHTPFMIYNGYIKEGEILTYIFIQLIWLILLIGLGRTLIKRALTKVVVQGG